jgi:hypothetical protein
MLQLFHELVGLGVWETNLPFSRFGCDLWPEYRISVNFFTSVIHNVVNTKAWPWFTIHFKWQISTSLHCSYWNIRLCFRKFGSMYSGCTWSQFWSSYWLANVILGFPQSLNPCLFTIQHYLFVSFTSSSSSSRFFLPLSSYFLLLLLLLLHLSLSVMNHRRSVMLRNQDILLSTEVQNWSIVIWSGRTILFEE